MTEEEAKIGTRIKCLIGFSGVPIGTEGVIDEDYDTGIMVAWDGPPNHKSLPVNYQVYDGRPIITTNILRDGFDKKTELQFLELVEKVS